MGRMVTQEDIVEEHARSCEYIVLTCCDFRIWEEELRRHLAHYQAEHHSYDLIAVPGATHRLVHGPEHKRQALFEDLDLLISVHNPETVVLIPHTHCAVYHASRSFACAEEEREALTDDIAAAYDLLTARFPRIAVQGYIAQIDPQQRRMSGITRTRFSIPPAPRSIPPFTP